MKRSVGLFLVALLAACDDSTTAGDAAVPDIAMPSDLGGDAAMNPPDLAVPTDASGDAGDGGAALRFCEMPGSYKWTSGGLVVVPGGPAGHDLSFIKLPPGFCAHWFGKVANTRQMKFAPSGELFVASPTKGTTGGGSGGQNAIVILPDDDHDGVADAPVNYLVGAPATQGFVFANNYFYYQDDAKIKRLPYKAGDRAAVVALSEQVANITIYYSALHWPKPLDVADDGTIYVGNGGDQGESCDPTHPFHGGILRLDATAQPMGAVPLIKGLRNPIGLQCGRGHNKCFALELALDYSAAQGGREKLIPIHDGDDWGFPCCATKDLPYAGITPVPDCSTVQPDTNSFIIGDTPMTVDFDNDDKWPAPWTGNAIVALHGAFGTWKGARVVSIGMDLNTGMPLPGTNLQGQPTGAMKDFATGWDDNSLSHGRPMAVAFSKDGRLFLGNDVNGDIVWIAPDTL